MATDNVAATRFYQKQFKTDVCHFLGLNQQPRKD